jgi:hypothetical protein
MLACASRYAEHKRPVALENFFEKRTAAADNWEIDENIVDRYRNGKAEP